MRPKENLKSCDDRQSAFSVARVPNAAADRLHIGCNAFPSTPCSCNTWFPLMICHTQEWRGSLARLAVLRMRISKQRGSSTMTCDEPSSLLFNLIPKTATMLLLEEWQG